MSEDAWPGPAEVVDRTVTDAIASLAPSHAYHFAGLVVSSIGVFTKSADLILHCEVIEPTAACISFMARSPEVPLRDIWCEDWSRFNELIFAALPPSAASAVAAEMLRHGRYPIVHVPCRVWSFSDSAVASALLCPIGISDEFVLDSLIPDDAPTLAHHWKYARGEETVQSLRNAIALFPTVCVRLRDGAASPGGHAFGGPRGLCAWSVTREDLSIGLLHTLEPYRGRGLARHVVTELVRKQLEWIRGLRSHATSVGDSVTLDATKHLRPYCHIAIGNRASERVFELCGFTPGECADWHVYTSETSDTRA